MVNETLTQKVSTQRPNRTKININKQTKKRCQNSDIKNRKPQKN